MRDRAVLDTGVIFALCFQEDASVRAVRAVDKISPIVLDLSIAEVGNAAKRGSLYLRKAWISLNWPMDKKMYEMEQFG